MDGSPRVTDVTFDQAKRGYDPEQVDAYLEELDQVVAELRRSWRSALDRADGLEANLAQASTSSTQAAEETVARTLVLAQRAADEAIAEARAEARLIIESATTDVAGLLAEAESARDDARREARSEVESLLEAARGAIEEDVAELAAQRDVLRHDVARLEEHLAAQRSRLRSSLGQLQKLVDLPETFRLDEAPELESTDPPMQPAPVREDQAPRMVRRPGAASHATITALPSREAAPAREAAVVAEPAAAPAAEPIAEQAPTAEPVAETVESSVAEPAPAPAAIAEEAPAAAAAAPLAPPVAEQQVALPEPTVASVADLTARRATQAAEQQAAAEAVVTADDELDESFLNELRRAVNDDGGLPAPVDAAEDEAMRAFFETDIDEPRRSRFGRRS